MKNVIVDAMIGTLLVVGSSQAFAKGGDRYPVLGQVEKVTFDSGEK